MSDERYTEEPVFNPLQDGEPVDINWRDHESVMFSCCDCGLVHHVEAVAAGNMIRLRFYRVPSLTEERRALRGIVIEDAPILLDGTEN